MLSACFLLTLITTAVIVGISVNIEPVQSTTASYTFSGYIYDSTGNVAPNAHVYLISQVNGRSAAQDYSDITGYYSLSVPSGTYNLVSRLIGSSQSTLKITL